ncbi:MULTISPECIES: IcmT/TraK family protein [Acidithiobacillus]|jgi:ABC-type sugar transport system permease subunit|uniref:Phosphoesterase n=2 Tax=Acidithiobacillus TaxID=119977 RepID=A0A179B6D3_ACIFR|nr:MULTISPECIES: IcmT/TraK family protein [Acidithiobacillus]MBU2845213.1 hypothetical protein [Acidithiobacillus ferriphilus]MEB8474439.1 IcmT/TraK family protein [Acidithiobacillus ferriphilus]MEB8486631.1 IcmT/TraK family protein [Acidithiobacillus ferriphilus]MEB8490900.1 IcmT/TraK family protein [Acidithiobacillus ferriphilus]MEB8493365.1 IcmT/TraK family protein [Acidithiobacillus ferriphilus]
MFLSDEDLEIENAWRFSSQDPKLWKLDGTAFWPLLILFFHFSVITLILAVLSMGLFAWLLRRGYTPAVAWRRLWRFVFGNTRLRGRV